MIIKLLIGVLVGVGLGAALGYFGQCSSGTCPLTANPFRGAIYGGVMGLLFAFTSGGTARKSPAEVIPPGEQPLPGEGLIHIATVEEFDRYVVAATMPCLADFYSDHCPPCRRLAPTIGKLAEKYRGRAVVCKVSTDAAPQLAQSHDIRGIPAVLFFDGGKEVARLVGQQPQKAYEQVLDNVLQQPPTQEK